MRHFRLISMVSALGLVVLLQGCAGTSAESMISKSDHEGLANYYANQAQELKQHASRAESLADVYQKLAESDPTSDEGKRLAARAVRSRTIAENYRKAAEEAGALAREHLAIRPHLRQ